MVFGMRSGLEHVPPEYQLFDGLTFSSLLLAGVNLRDMKTYGGE